MRKLVNGIIYLLVALVVVIAGGAYLIPPVAVVERDTVINAPPETVYAIVSDLRRTNEWSPWATLDPNTAYRFEGPKQGVGQTMTWKSNDPDVGNGRQTISETIANEKVVSELDFGEMGRAETSFTLSPAEGGTAVTWEFRRVSSGIFESWISLMFDKWIGADFVKGLASLKTLAEKEAAAGG